MMDDTSKITGSPVIAEQHSQHQPAMAKSMRVKRGKKTPALSNASTNLEEDAILMHEEDRMLEIDEEITSEEEDNHVAEKMERKLMTVALVKSVVETGANGSSGEYAPKLEGNNSLMQKALHQPQLPASIAGGPKGGRYGLRKRRRSGDTSPKLPEPSRSIGNNSTDISRLIKGGASRNDNVKISEGVPLPMPPASSLVPNPLASLPIPPPPMLPTATITTAHAATNQNNSIRPVAGVPCPLSSALPPEIDIPMLPPANVIRKELPPPETIPEKRKVTINEETVRTRGMSIDMDSIGFSFGEEDQSHSHPGEFLPSSSGGRGRAFSFECFAFGISADEPLPPLSETLPTVLPTHPGQPPKQDLDPIPPVETQPEEFPAKRPRGDSIIFDPSSFQEGGIHEKSALETARAPSSDIPGLGPRSCHVTVKPDENGSKQPQPLPAPAPVVAPPVPNVVESNGPASQPVFPSVPLSAVPPVTSYTATTTTESSTTTTTVTVTASAATAAAASMAMELLNKDGRIGIYLPEARKARIARFHAKRARRIWRKRIKYDCRKKLADSRPRIKGRFVKRSDMEDE